MLDRVLEPEAMDTEDEARDYDAMDHAGVNARFVADFLAAHGPCRGGEVLDVGTGTALIPIGLARLDARARIVGVDLAGSMLDLAASNVDRAGLADRIRLRAADAKALDVPDGRYEAVIANTIVHHIPDPAPALAEMARVVAPGGTVFVRDLARPSSGAEVVALVETHASGETATARALFDASLRAALTLGEARTLVERLGCPAEGVVLTSDRHWTWTWRRPG